MSEFYQKPGDVLDKRCRPTNVNFRILLGRKADLTEQRTSDSPARTRPPLWLIAGQRIDNAQISIAARHHIEFLSMDEVVQTSGWIQQQSWSVNLPPGAVTEHRHQGRNARSACNEPYRAVRGDRPNKIAADRST